MSISSSRRSFIKLALLLLPVRLLTTGEDSNGEWHFDPTLPFERLTANPIITPDMADLGGNINGPSLIRVPDWIERPLGKYYLYFAHHRGKYIRLAYADELSGPWKIYEPGTLHLADTVLKNHLASPDVHVDYDQKRIRMYAHGVFSENQLTPKQIEDNMVPGPQGTIVAVSEDGLNFEAYPEILGLSYFRVFHWQDFYYALAMPGVFYRSSDGLTGFEKGPTLFDENMRHSAVLISDSTLYVFFSQVGNAPERILLSSIDLTTDWYDWRTSPPVTVLESETVLEGADLPVNPSQRGIARRPVHQLRDPAIYREGEQVYLLYSVAGEQGIAIARQVNG